MITLDSLTLALAAMMVGSEVAVGAFVHPVLWRMEERSHAHAASALAATLGGFMPFWYAATLLLTLAAVWEHRGLSLTHGPAPAVIAAAAGWFLSIVFTLLGLLPINRRLAAMDPDLPHREWLNDRSRWDTLHRWRILLLLLSLSLLSAGVLGIWRDYIPLIPGAGATT